MMEGQFNKPDIQEIEGWDYFYPIDESRYQRVNSDDIVSEVIVHEDSADTLKRIEQKICGLSDQLYKHDKKGTEERRLLMYKIESLEKENAYYRRQMASIYSPEKLQIGSALICTIFLFFLGLSIFFDVQIVHPILSCTASFTSFVFFLMSFLIKKENLS